MNSAGLKNNSMQQRRRDFVVAMLGYMVGGQLGKQFGGKAIIILRLHGSYHNILGHGRVVVEQWIVHDDCVEFADLCWAMVSINIYSLMMRITWTEVEAAIHRIWQ